MRFFFDTVRRKRLLWRWRLKALYAAAYVWRSLLFRTTFIAVTGSVGKTTTKESIAAILSAHFSTAKTLRNQNDRYGVPRTILRIRPWHRFAVIEVATDGPGLIRRSARLLRPHIAVVLAVARTHTNAFRSLDETAAEKASLLDALPPDGLAVLNADDPRVRAMSERCRCKVEMFGRSASLSLWADEISSRWPSRLAFRACTGSASRRIATKLVGEHWVSSALAALLTGLSCGVRLEDAAAALEQVEPFAARMQPLFLPSGAAVLRDELSGDPDSMRAALHVMKECKTARRILVSGDISDFGNKRPRNRLKELGKTAQQIADLAVFIGPHARYAVRAGIASGMKPDCIFGFTDLRRAAEYLRTELHSGDLVLLRGRATEHLSRVFFAQFGTIGCWKTNCRKTISCDFCPELRPSFDLESIDRVPAGSGAEPRRTAKL